MDSKEKQYVWMDGKMVEKEHAMVPIMTHGLHYGTGVFEGIRIYQTPKGKAVFRLRDHMVRFEQSAKALNMKIPFSVEEMCEAVREVVRVNPPRMDYIRPIAYYGQNKEDKIVLNPASFSTNVAVALAHMGAYLGKENMEKGAKVITVSWQKPTNACTSLQAKITGNYVNSVLCKIESNMHGADEGLMLNSNGTVAEGPGENIFMVKKGKLITPPISLLRAGGHHQGLGADHRPGPGLPAHRARDNQGGDLERRRVLHDRHGGRGHPDRILGRQDHRQRQARTDHQAHPGDVLRGGPRQRPQVRCLAGLRGEEVSVS